MNTKNLYKQMLPTVHKCHLPQLEDFFSALKRMLTETRSTMTEVRLNNCFLLHAHKELTDSLN